MLDWVKVMYLCDVFCAIYIKVLSFVCMHELFFSLQVISDIIWHLI